MKKLVLFVLMIVILYANSKAEKDKYIEYVNEIVNYKFFIDKINKIKSPFFNYTKNVNSVNKNIKIQKRIEIVLLSIFDNKAYIKINKYIGSQLVSSKKIWINKNKKILGCKLVKLTNTDAFFKCRKKTLHKTLNSKIFNIRNK